MKKFKYIIAALLTLAIVQGGWAMNPGGALGGGGKSVQAHPTNEGKLENEHGAEAAGPSAIDIVEAPIKERIAPVQVKKIKIGKQGSEAQSSQSMDAEGFAAAFEKMEAEKSAHYAFKAAITRYRMEHPETAPESPVGSSLLWLTLLALILPPLAVYLKTEEVGSEFWMSVLLTPMLILPGFAYAAYIVTRQA